MKPTLPLAKMDEVQGRAAPDLNGAAPELLAACVAMLGYMTSGYLVRNTNDDHRPEWALKALAFVRDLRAMQDAIAKATGGAP